MSLRPALVATHQCPHCDLFYDLRTHRACAKCGHPYTCDSMMCRLDAPERLRPEIVDLQTWLEEPGWDVRVSVSGDFEDDLPF